MAGIVGQARRTRKKYYLDCWRRLETLIVQICRSWMFLVSDYKARNVAR